MLAIFSRLLLNPTCICERKNCSIVQSLKIPYLTWQVFFQKSKSFLIAITESYYNISLGIELRSEKKRYESSSLEADKQLNAINEHYWCSCPMCIENRKCSAPGGYWCRELKCNVRVVNIKLLKVAKLQG